MTDKQKQKPERSDIRIDAVYDLETESWNKFVVGGVYYDKDKAYDWYDWKREEDLFDALCAVRGPNDTVGNVWAHNGGRFDNKWAIDWAIRKGLPCDAVSAGSNIICATIGRTRFLDSKALTKISLEELTKGANIAKESLGLQCVGTAGGCSDEPEECRGYCAIRRDMPAHMFKRLLSYLEADCRSLYDALQGIRRYAQENDLDLGISVGSAAWKCAKRWCELPRAQLGKADHMFCRRGYFGGRVQIFRRKAFAGYEYDVNSMYPSRLAFEKLPVGPARRITGDACRIAFGKVPGVFRARVNVPVMHVPPLPLRIGTRVCYPTGVFTGTWTSPELLYAESVGVEIEALEEALVWPHEQIIFADWVRKIFDLRKNALGWDGKPDKKGPLGTWLKFYANSLTGKFGSRPDTEKVKINPTLEELEEHTCVCRTQFKRHFGCKCGAWVPLSSTTPIFAVKQWFIQPCAHIEWASYLTSLARVEWHKQATSVDGGWDMVYGDTDSVFCTKPRHHNIGDDLGQWGANEPWTMFEAFAPKVYRLDSDKGLKVKAKGLRLPSRKVTRENSDGTLDSVWEVNGPVAEKMIRDGVGIGKESILGFRAGARIGKFFETGETKRVINIGYGDRILCKGDVTRAPTFSEAMDRFGT